MATHRKPRNPKPARSTSSGQATSTSSGQATSTSSGQATSTSSGQATSKHGSDSQAYKVLDSQRGTLQPRPFPIAGDTEPTLKLADTLGSKGADIENAITRAGQIVFSFVGGHRQHVGTTRYGVSG